MINTITDAFSSAAAARSGAPKYRVLADAIGEAILRGDLVPGDRLPPVRRLAGELGVTPGTVARAYSIMTDDGRLRATVGRGTFVALTADAAPAPRRPATAGAPARLPPPSRAVDLLATHLPDLGQAAEARALLAEIALDDAGDAAALWLDYPSRAAFAPARDAVLEWLGDAALGAVSADDLVLSQGAQAGVMLVMQSVLRGARPVVATEALSYPGFQRAARLMRAAVVSVPMDASGPIPEALDEIARRVDLQLFCTCAEIHNPTTGFTPEARRREIARVAEARGFQILEDDCYRIGASRAPSYRALAPARGWYVSSLSKSLTPALRIGFALAPEPHRAALRRAAEDGYFGLSRPLAELVTRWLPRPETQELAQSVRREVGRYAAAAAGRLRGYDVAWRPEAPFLWLTLPQGWRAAGFVQAAEAAGVPIRPAEDFALRDGHAPHAVRLAVDAQVPLPVFVEAVDRLRALLDDPPERPAV